MVEYRKGFHFFTVGRADGFTQWPYLLGTLGNLFFGG